MGKIADRELVPFVVYLSKEQKKNLKDISSIEVRSMSSIVREAINDYCNKMFPDEWLSRLKDNNN
jgi:predicted DNA-binding protein